MSEALSPLQQLDRQYVWHPFTQAQTAPAPLGIRRGSGALLEDENGRQLLDLVSSWWVNLHGHANPQIARAIALQASTLEQVMFAGFTHQPASELAAQLVQALPDGLDRVFYSDNGSTAIEVAMKAALQMRHNQGDLRRSRFLAFEGGYHGDTVGAMSAGASSGYFSPWHSMLFPVDSLPLPVTWIDDALVDAREAACLEALDRHLQQHGDTTVAAIIEPLVQGAGGMRMHRASFLGELVRRLRRAGVLVVFDEVMTGFGRTGPLFACLAGGESPDMICLSKGLTGGFLPMAATVVSDAVCQAFLDASVGRAFLHGHSYTANPLGCAAGLASLALTLDPACTARRRQIEQMHRQQLAGLVAALPDVVCEPRIQGTIAAFTLRLPGQEDGYASQVGPRITALCERQGLVVRPMGNVLYLLPPYCITDEQLEQGWQGIAAAVRALVA